MALYLVQHGVSLSREDDPERGLSEEGAAEVKQIAAQASGNGVKVDAIRHSGKKRAKQTAEILAKALEPSDGVREMDGLKPMDDVTAIAGKLRGDENVMLVGHLPFMARLAGYLLAGSAESQVVKFQNAGIVCLVQDPESLAWMIGWMFVPRYE